MVNFPILILFIFIGVEIIYSMIAYERECDFLMGVNEAGRDSYFNICMDSNLIKSEIQNRLNIWGNTYNVSKTKVLSILSQNKINACAAWRQNVLKNITNYANDNFKGNLLAYVTDLINILSSDSITRVQECNATFPMFEGNSSKYEHMGCMQRPPSSCVCGESMYPKECHIGRIPMLMMGRTEHDDPINFKHVMEMGNEGMDKLKEFGKEGKEKLEGVIENFKEMWKGESTTQHT
ncbi:hypothetical protein Mgra_00000581 [Meloidogyne graminicola]|uniref:Uncharacterized protein n=1 Tax=Meloidogyne graminicola TaxID=189291 RepID=A0A8T0A436_9BILA|nr:hypothetical protein Mgra_00000581 [Meloidogyne graminicola]